MSISLPCASTARDSATTPVLNHGRGGSYRLSVLWLLPKNFSISEIHTFAREYLLSWFPKLPSYQTFTARLNMLSEALKVLAEAMIQSFKPKDCDSLISIVDSFRL